MAIKFNSQIRVCCSLNFAPHYREEIFLRMEKELDCDFFFGDRTYGAIEKMDYSKFHKKVEELTFTNVFKNIYFLKGQTKLSSSNYGHYVITGQPFNLSAWALLLLNKARGKKTFIWNHGWYGNENFSKKILKKVQLKLASGYFLYGSYAKNLMVKEGFDSNKLHVIYNSLSYTEQLRVRNQLVKTSIYSDRFDNTNPTLLFIGRLTEIKKLHLVIEAMQLAFEERNYFNVVIIGEGTEKQFLETLVEKSNLKDNTWFYGSCYEEERIGELIYNADVCVSPGNIGLTAIHSLMYGTPALTHDNFPNQMPEFEAIESGITGCFFKENDPVNLKESIVQWLKKHPKKEDNLIKMCFEKIDMYYNPNYQIKILKEVLR
jgi:glycosyltransferase involved in cell wall biosynthesis